MNELTVINNDITDIKAVTPAETETAKIRFSTTYEDKMLFNATSSTATPVSEIVDEEPITVTNIIVTNAVVHEDKNDENSPLINRPCVHFFTDDGNHYSTLSNGIVKTTCDLIELGLSPTNETPLAIRFKSVNTKKGTCFVFEMV